MIQDLAHEEIALVTRIASMHGVGVQDLFQPTRIGGPALQARNKAARVLYREHGYSVEALAVVFNRERSVIGVAVHRARKEAQCQTAA